MTMDEMLNGETCSQWYERVKPELDLLAGNEKTMTFQPSQALIESWTLQAHVLHSHAVGAVLRYHKQGFYSFAQAVDRIAELHRILEENLEQITNDPMALFAEHRQESADHLRENQNENFA